MVKEVIIPYKPHDGQISVHNDNHRFKTIVCGRRWGKTIMAINELIKKGIEKIGDYWYIAPTYTQAKRIAWELLKFYAVPQIRGKLNEADLSVKLINGTNLRLMGADNPESLRGTGLDGCVLDEDADIKRILWQTVIRPMLTDRRGWAWKIGTPKGKLNHLYEDFIRDQEFKDISYVSIDGLTIEPDKDYKSFKFKTSDNPYIPKEEIEKARQELNPQYFRQEFEASFENFTGIVYKELDDKNIIDSVKLESWWAYYVGIDTGRNTAITFHVIDENDYAIQFDEIIDYDGVVADICTQIKAKCSLYHIKPIFIIDSASQTKREYEKNGIFAIDSEKDVQNSINIIRNRYQTGKLKHTKNCRISIVEHKGYIWSDKTGRNGQPEPVHENDHTVSGNQYVYNYIALHRGGETPKEKEFKKSLAYMTQGQPKVKWLERG